jgi:hypothetical protein
MSISQNFPTISPSLNLNFARSKKLDPRITFNRTSTATRVNSNGLVQSVAANVPRFDHSYNATTASSVSLGLLIEEDRTNYLQYSQAPATSPWQILNAGGSSVTNNTTVAPDGTTTAATFTCGTNSDSIFQDVGSLVGNTSYTMSVFIKAGTANDIVLAAFFTGNITELFINTRFNPITGQVTFGNAIVETFPNGWYRLTATGTGTNALNNNIRYQIYSGGTGTVFLWGAQLEFGRHKTSYIPTTNAQVTRTADYASITGTSFSSWFNATEGTSVMTYDKYYAPDQFDLPRYPTIFCFNGWPTRITHADYGGIFQEMNVVISTTFVAQMTGSGSRPVNTPLKFAGAYKENDFAAIGTDRILNTDTSGAVPTGLNIACIGNENLASTSLLNGHIMQILYYPKRLTNTQLVNLTR